MTSKVQRRTLTAVVVVLLGAPIVAAGCTATSTDSTGAVAVDGAAGEPKSTVLRSPTTTTTTNNTTAARPARTVTPPTSEPGPTSSPTINPATTTTTSTTTSSTTSTTEAPLTGWEATDAYLQSRLIDSGDAAASFAVSIDGEIVHTAALGIRSSIESDPTQPTDRFRIASISKTISAITMLQLVEDGVVGLDDPVGWLVAASLGVEATPGGTADITVRQLLSHSSGFGQYENMFFGGQVGSCREAAAAGLNRPLQGTPGVTFRYSNMNYCVIGLLIEVLTGTSYEQAAYEHVLTPLRISGMRLAPTYDPGPDEVEHRTVIGRNYMEVLGSAGAWVATPSDLVKIIDSLDLTKPGWKPLDEETLAAMQTSAIDLLVPDRGYGLGLMLFGGGAYGHTGTIESTHAMVLDRNDGVTWALTVSGEYPSATGELAGIVDRALAAGGFVAAAPLVLD